MNSIRRSFRDFHSYRWYKRHFNLFYTSFVRKFLLFSAIVTLFVLGIFFFLSYQARYSFGPVKEPQVFEVRLGEDVFSVGRHLEAQGIIQSSLPFVWQLIKEKELHSLVAGEYTVSGSQPIAEIAHMLTRGNVKEAPQDKRITFPE